MHITVKFFASLRENLGSSLRLELPGQEATVAQVRLALQARGEAFEAALDPGRAVRAALNHQLVGDAEAALVQDGDELAFFPPVTGG